MNKYLILILLMMSVMKLEDDIPQRRKLHEIESSLFVQEIKDLMEKSNKEVFTHSDVCDFLLRIHSDSDLKEIETIEKLIKENHRLNLREDHLNFMKHKIDDFLKLTKKENFSKEDILEIFEKSLFLEYIQNKIDKLEENKVYPHPKDLEYVHKNRHDLGYEFHEEL